MFTELSPEEEKQAFQREAVYLLLYQFLGFMIIGAGIIYFFKGQQLNGLSLTLLGYFFNQTSLLRANVMALWSALPKDVKKAYLQKLESFTE